MADARSRQRAPPGQVVALRMDRATGKDVSGDLSSLLYILANACANVAKEEHFTKIQKYLTSFLFDEGRQALRVLISMHGKDVEIQHSVNQMVNTFPLTRTFGDVDILFQFRPNVEKGSETNLNELRIGAGLVGFGPLDIIAYKIRRYIAVCMDEGKAHAYPRDMANSIIDALLQVFPNGHQFLTDLLEMDTFEFELYPHADDALMAEVDAEVNIERLDDLYPAVANWLRHVQEVDFAVLDVNANGTEPEADLDDAPCFFKVHFAYDNAWVKVRTRFLLVCGEGEELGQLGWFSYGQERALKDDTGATRRVKFEENEPGKETQFRICLRHTVRLHELGCGSFALPMAIILVTIKSSSLRFPHRYDPRPSPAHRIEMKVVYVGEKRFASIFVRPFLNLNAFRELLLSDFRVEIDVIPSTKEKYDYFANNDLEKSFEIVPGHWSLVFRLKMLIVPASSLLVKFFRMFTSTQLANPDDLRFWWQIASALHKDLKLMHGRISRAEGTTPSFDISYDEQTMFRPRTKKPSRMRCVIA